MTGVEAKKPKKSQRPPYFVNALTHPLKVITSRRDANLPYGGSLGRNRFFKEGNAAYLEVAPNLEKAGNKSFLTSVASLLIMSGVLKNDPNLARTGYELMEADVVWTPVNSNSRPIDYGVKIPEQTRISNRAGLSVQGVMAMRNIFEYPDADHLSTSFNGQRLLNLLVMDRDALIDQDIVGDAQRRETLRVMVHRALTTAGPAALVGIPLVIKDILDSEPSKMRMWLENVPLLDALVGAGVGFVTGALVDRQKSTLLDNDSAHITRRIVGTIVGAIAGGGGGLIIDRFTGEDLKLLNIALADMALMGGALAKGADVTFFRPKAKIKQAFEDGIDFLQANKRDVVPFASSVFHQQGRQRVEHYNRKKKPETVVSMKRQAFARTEAYATKQFGITHEELLKAMAAPIANDRDPIIVGDAIHKMVSSSYARTMLASSLVDNARMLDHDRRFPEKYELLPILSPRDLRDYVYTHGAAMVGGIDLTKAPERNPALALSILFPSIWVYNLLDFHMPASKSEENEKSLKDAVNFAGRYENTGGTGARLLAAFQFWGENWQQIIATNQFQDFYKIIADNFNEGNAEGMRNYFSLVVQPPPFYEMLNALSAFYLDFTLPEEHGTDKRGAVKHIDSMVTSLVNQIDQKPRALMDLLTFVSYCKAIKMAKPYFEDFGYNIPLDKGRNFLDVSIANMDGVANRALQVLYSKYLTDTTGLVTGFAGKIKAGPLTPEEVKRGMVTPERVPAIYRELSTLLEWTLREVPEFFSTREGGQVLGLLNPDLYERAGVYSAGSVFSGAFIDIFYNVYTVLGHIREREGWELNDERTQAILRLRTITDQTIFNFVRNTLNVNMSPSHAAALDITQLRRYLSDNYTFFEFAINFIDADRLCQISEILLEKLELLENQPDNYTSDSFSESEWGEGQSKANLILASVAPRIVAELRSRKLMNDAAHLAEKLKSASIAIATSQKDKARSRRNLTVS